MSTLTTATDSIRATKRKLDDAFQTLDDAVGGQEYSATPPVKRPLTTRSLYSTLAKYGIKAKNPHLPETTSLASSLKTPHLTAILSRAASKKRKNLPSFTPATGVSEAEYRPSSIPSFLSRLSTYKLATYANKPAAIDAVAAAKCGWVNEGKDRLLCNICHISWVVAGREGLNRDAANALIDKQKTSLVNMHKPGCPWKTRQCEDNIYRIPLRSPATMIKEIKENALKLDDVLHDVEVKHPLTAHQLTSLKNAITSFVVLAEGTEDCDPPTSPSPSTTQQPSDTAMLSSLFGWSIVPERPRLPLRSSSLSCSSSPAISRASSVAPGGVERPSTPVTPTFLTRPPVTTETASLLECALCQRRVGLWAFKPPASPSATGSSPMRVPHQQRQFDLLQEHRSYCPYVVKSTVVPSLPAHSPTTPTTTFNRSSNSQMNGQMAQEGWKAVLTVIQRYSLGHRLRQRTVESNGTITDATPLDSDDRMAVDVVEAMVEGVKSRGGLDLLRYVKGLLG